MNNYNYFDTFNETFLDVPMQGYNPSNNSNFNQNSNMNNSQINSLFGPYEGYTKGNMFRNLYEQYKNYQPAILTPRNEKEEALLNLNQMQFAMHDLNLYLDVYPNDMTMMRQFVSFRNTYNKLLSDYENKYGAIEVNSPTLNNTPFGWEEQTWPWEMRGV